MADKKENKFAQNGSATVFQELKSSEQGLSANEAHERLKKYGLNVIKKGKKENQWKAFLRHFSSTMAILLWAAGIIAMISNNVELGIAMWMVNIINGLFSYWQERRAQKATDALTKMLPSYVRVIRDGKKVQVDAKELVPGDVYSIQAGDAIPADSRLFRATSLQVDQSSLTGESVPESKTVEYSAGEGQHAESNIVYAGTTVGAGTGYAVVYATGMNTVFGQIASLTQKEDNNESPLQKELAQLTKRISQIAISLGIVFFLAALFFVRYPLVKSFIFALGMIVAFIPEGLLPTVTLSLANGVRRMAKKHALVKDLNSVETLGSTTVICSDKTGTLTQNQMTVHYIWTPKAEYKVSGDGYFNNGNIKLDDKQMWYDQNPDLKRIIEIGALDNDTSIENSDDTTKKPKILGTPTEAALTIMAQKAGYDKQRQLIKMPRLREYPFDSVRKRMSTVNELNEKEAILLVKGSFSDTLKYCDTIQIDGQVKELTDEERQEIKDVNTSYAEKGLRSMAFAYRTYDAKIDFNAMTADEAERHMTFVGLATMSDPPRPEIYEAVRQCHEAKIKIIMVTGDSKLTAKSVAVKIGITSDKARVIGGNELDRMSKEELEEALKGEVIFARVAPEQKYKIVSTLQANGEVVAATGDGVNDAPALKKADVGVAMGETGTDVAKEAANVILTDDNFASIVAAVEEGRAVYSNIRKFLTYILASNVPEAVPSILFLFSGGLIPLPMTIMQILVIDLGTDLIPGLGLGSEPADPDVMHEPPRKRTDHLLNKKVIVKAFFWYGLIEAIVAMGAYFFVNYQNGWPATALATQGPVYIRATTMVLGAIIFTQVANVLNIRFSKSSIFNKRLFANHTIWFGIIFEIILFFILTVTPGIHEVFNTTMLNGADWLLLFAIPIPIILIDELRKKLMYRRNS